jgi:glycerophosphoryl diester phosphodiesterase
MIVAHRGASAEAPENTLAAFRLAWERGADAIEGDFYLTSDGHIVAIHDNTTKRVAGGVDLAVARSTLAELQTLDLGAGAAQPYRGERIPTLEQVLGIVPAEKKIFLEIKCGPEIVPKLQEVLRASSLATHQVVIIAFSESVITEVKRQMPQCKAYWLVGFKQDETTRRWSPSVEEVFGTLDRIGADGLDVQANSQIVDKAFVDQLRGRGKEFHVWTVDKPSEARHFQALGADSITTNRPADIRAALH